MSTPKKKQPLSARLVPKKALTKSGKGQVQKNENFAYNMRHFTDIREASAIVGEHAGLKFDHEHGEVVALKEQILEELNSRYDVSRDELAKLEQRRRDTKRWVKSAPLLSGTDNEAPSFRDWNIRDKGMIGLILLMLPAAMVMGATNVYANLMASGTPAFIENPWLAVSLSMLMPIGSTAIKFVTNAIHIDYWRTKYSQLIYFLTFVLFIFWGILFGQTYTGAAGGLDIDALMDGGGSSGSALVWTQLLLELLAASSLFLALEEIVMRYFPDMWISNVEFYVADQAYKTHQGAHEKLNKLRGETHGSLASLRALREVRVNEAMAAYLEMRASNHPKFDL